MNPPTTQLVEAAPETGTLRELPVPLPVPVFVPMVVLEYSAAEIA